MAGRSVLGGTVTIFGRMAGLIQRLLIGSRRYSALAALLLLGASMWVVFHGRWVPDFPEAFSEVIQALPGSLPVLLVWWLGAAGWGSLLRSRLLPAYDTSLVVTLALGAGGQLFLFWLLGLLGWTGGAVSWAVCLVGALWAWHRLAGRDRLENLRPEHWPSPPWTLLAGIPVFGFAVVAALCPPGTIWRVEAMGYDVLLYHLQLPREWLSAGRIEGLEHNVYSYLPNLMEAGYLSILGMRGAGQAGFTTSALLHLGFAILTAGAISGLVRRWCESISAVAGAVLFMLVPWTVITGTLAYNEMLMLAFGVTALVLMFEPSAMTRGRVVAVGVLLGLAILAKPSGLVLWVLPLLIVGPWLIGRGGRAGRGRSPSRVEGEKKAILGRRRNGNGREARGLASAAERWVDGPVGHRFVAVGLIGVVIGLTVLPWGVRNVVWQMGKGVEFGQLNPVFPLGIGVFGRAHWTAEQAQRWNHAHHPGRTSGEIAYRFGRDGLFSEGFGAVGGRSAGPGVEVARFDREWGVPLLLILAGLSLASLVPAEGWSRVGRLVGGRGAVAEDVKAGGPGDSRGVGGSAGMAGSGGTGDSRGSGGEDLGSQRRMAMLLGAMVLLQVLFWALLTHHQGRFLIVTVPALCVMVGLGAERLRTCRRVPPWSFAAVVIVIGLSMTVQMYGLMLSQTVRVIVPATPGSVPGTREMVPAVPALILSTPELFSHPLDAQISAARGRTILVADNQGLASIRNAVEYATAWDEDRLAWWLDRAATAGVMTPDQLRVFLRSAGIHHVWFGWGELRRLEKTYGYAPRMNAGVIEELVRQRVLVELIAFPDRGAVLYRVR